jgi:FMN phosphatase YigB (HAD superfamily)
MTAPSTTPSGASSAASSAVSSEVVFLLDVDNTLLDNDRVSRDLSDHLESVLGKPCRDRYFELFEELRAELGYTDYLGTLQRLRAVDPDNPRLLLMSSYLVDYPFPDRLFPNAIQAIRHLSKSGRTVILSDGDVVFQPRKIQRSGLWDAVDGNVLIYIHKEQMLEEVTKHYPAAHYVMIDDKVRILAAMKAVWGNKLTTVFPRQGHYALDAKQVASFPTPDVTIEHIGDLLNLDIGAMLAEQTR